MTPEDIAEALIEIDNLEHFTLLLKKQLTALQTILLQKDAVQAEIKIAGQKSVVLLKVTKDIENLQEVMRSQAVDYLLDVCNNVVHDLPARAVEIKTALQVLPKCSEDWKEFNESG